MRMRQYGTFVFLFAAVLFFGGCQDRSSADFPLKIGMNQWVGYTPIRIALDKNFYGDSAVSVSILGSASEVIDALRNGFLDVAALTLDEALFLSRELDDLQVFLVCDLSSGGDAIVARKTVASLDDLEGKIVGVEPGVLGAFVLARALERHTALHMEDVIVRPLRFNDQVAAFSDHTVDAVVTYAPNKSRLLGLGGHVIFDSSMIPGEIVDVLVVRSETAQKKSRDIRNLAEGWFKAEAFMTRSKSAAFMMFTAYHKMPVSEMKTILEGITIPSLKENYRLLDKQKGVLKISEKRLRRFLNEKGVLKDSGGPLLAFTTAYLPKADKP